MKEITYEIIDHFGVYEEHSGGWKGEVNLISWNGKDPKVDIRNWDEERSKCSKGVSMSMEAARLLGEILVRL